MGDNIKSEEKNTKSGTINGVLSVKINKKRNKLILIGVSILFLGFFSYWYWNSNFVISPEEEKVKLSEAKLLLEKGDKNGADQKYQYVISKKRTAKEKSEIYIIQSGECMKNQFSDCALTSLENAGNNVQNDFQYYISLGTLYRINGYTDKMMIAYQKAYEDMKNRTDLNDTNKELLKELEVYINENK